MTEHCTCCLCVPKRNKVCDVCHVRFTNVKHFYRTRLFRLMYPTDKRNICRMCSDNLIMKAEKPGLKINSEEVLVSFN